MKNKKQIITGELVIILVFIVVILMLLVHCSTKSENSMKEDLKTLGISDDFSMTVNGKIMIIKKSGTKTIDSAFWNVEKPITIYLSLDDKNVFTEHKHDTTFIITYKK
jgi:hypothetical protein